MTQLLDAAALESAAEYKVQAVLNTFLRQRCNELEFAGQLIAICREQPNAAWQALASLDQLHRRSALTPELYRSLKEKLNEVVFCSTGTYISLPARRDNAPSELESMLEVEADEIPGEDEQPQSTQTQSTQTHSTLPRSANATSFHAVRLGAIIHDRYLLIETLAIGQASITFRARDQLRGSFPLSEQFVAVRCLADHVQFDPHAIVALQNECAHLQGIAHANIPKVHDIHDAPGECSLVLELPEGDFLNRIVERGTAKRLNPSIALTIVREIGFALANAHDNGVTHGALNPSQVLITKEGGLRVYGFAPSDPWVLASVQSPDEESTPGLSPAMRRYASPRRRAVAHATMSDDLYSLAAIAFELLTGQLVDVDASRLYGSQKPKSLRHLSDRHWCALRRGLAEDPRRRGHDIRAWLHEFDLERARWRLPSLDELESKGR